MENSLDCLVCLDLLSEPVTTPCGHTFCKYCLFTYLKENHKCPVCRKFLNLDKDKLSKNILLTDLAKNSNPKKYEERRLHHLSLMDENESNEVSQVHQYIFIKDFFVIPNSSYILSIPIINNLSVQNELTLRQAFYGSKRLVIVSSTDIINNSNSENDNNISRNINGSLVELLEFRTINGNSNLNSNNQNEVTSFIKIKVMGISRFKVHSYKTIPDEHNENVNINICEGKIIKDLLLDENDYKYNNDNNNINSSEKEKIKLEVEKVVKQEITDKSDFIKNCFVQIFQKSSSCIQKLFIEKFGNLPSFMSRENNINLFNSSCINLADKNDKFISHYESLVFQLVSCLKLDIEEKRLAFMSVNLSRKVDNLFRVFEKLEKDKLLDNQSLGGEIFDIEVPGKEINDSKLLLIILFVLLVVVWFYKKFNS